MKSQVIMAMVVFFLTNHFAVAGERIVTYDIFNLQEEINAKDTLEGIMDVGIYKVPRKVKYTESESCQFDDSPNCNSVEILEEVKVIQIKVQYQNGTWTNSDENPTNFLEFNFPLNSISQEDLLIISEKSRGWDFSGKKARARKIIANKLFEVKSVMTKKVISTIDYDKSTLCYPEDIYCEENLIYKQIEIKVQKVNAALKTN
jgi:hypothetical protein